MKHKESTPYATFQLKAECPSIVTMDKCVRFTISLKHLERSHDIPVPPPVFLRHILVRVESRTLVRVPHDSIFGGATELQESYSEKYSLLERGFSEGGGMLLHDRLPVKTNKWPVQLSPGFRGYGLNLEHTMDIKIWGECGGEKFELRLVHGKLLGVLIQGVDSGEVSVAASQEVDAEDEFMPPPPVEEDVAPPPYQVLGKS
jgi:hypothetical protein